MQAICKDGTMIHCEKFEATDSGVLFFQAKPSQGEESDEEEGEEEESADGFIPVTELRFVLPDEMVQQQAMGQQAAQPGQQQPAMQRQSAQATQQQQMQQQPGVPPQQQQQPSEFRGGQER